MLGVLALLLLGRPLLLFFALLKGQFRRPTFVWADESEVGAHVSEYLAAGAAPLRELGFVPVGFARQRSLEVVEHGESFALVLEHEPTRAHAHVGCDNLGMGVKVGFAAELDDGSWLETLHGESGLLMSPYPGTELIDVERPETLALWQAFEARLAARATGARVVPYDGPGWVAARARWIDRWFEAWCERGVLQRAHQAEHFELALSHAARLSWKLGRTAATYATFQMARAKLAAQRVPLSEQIRTYRVVRELNERRSTRWRVGSVLVVTSVLFALSMLHIMPAWDMFVLVGVVMFHELGHYAAMRALGYRDTSIFFIPFFGAATRGTKPDARAHEQLVVLLAGPLPGIVLAVLVAVFFPSVLADPRVRTLVDMAVIINVLNLFPIFPLDGGRVVQVICGNAGAWVEVAIRVFGALMLLALGVFGGDPIMLAVGVVLVLAIPAARRAAAAVRRIRALGEVPNEEEARLSLLFSELQTNQPSLPPPRRFAVVMPVAERLRQGSLSLAGALGWGAGYFVCMASSMAALVFVTVFATPDDRPDTRPVECSELAQLAARLPDAPGTFSMTCSLVDPERATAMHDAIEALSMVPQSSCLRAPWHGDLGRPPEVIASEERARRTIVALAAEAKRVFESLPPGMLASDPDRRSALPSRGGSKSTLRTARTTRWSPRNGWRSSVTGTRSRRTTPTTATRAIHGWRRCSTGWDGEASSAPTRNARPSRSRCHPRPRVRSSSPAAAPACATISSSSAATCADRVAS